MRRLLALCFAALFVASAQAQVGLTGYPSNGQLPGTAKNDSASAGNVGQIISASTAETGAAQTSVSGATITIASPAVVTWATAIPYGFSGTGCAVVNFTTTGALPTGVVAGTNYYVVGSSVSGNTFQIATTCDNAIAGTAINTSGTQSGVHTGVPTAIMATGTALNIVGISLPAGDWDVTSDLAFFPGATTSVTNMSAGTNTTTAAIGLNPGQSSVLALAAEVPGANNSVRHAGPRRYSLSATTTVYGVASSAFTVSTMSGWGGIRARRVR